jgi:muramoyltetrapeptide carboxypeptidase
MPTTLNQKSILPARLQPGDTIGVFHPSGPIRDSAAFESGLHILRELGLQIRHQYPDNSGPDYLAANDNKRISELHALWADDEVKALIAARGGYGCLRLMPQLDLDFIQRHPKWLIGFSDLTVLLNGIFTKTGVITMHGPVVSSLPRLDSRSMDSFRDQLSGRFTEYFHIPGLEILRNSTGQGHLTGGNLTTLAHLIGTPWQPEFTGSILFLEDTAEPAYKLDRMLTHLSSCGLLDNLAGLVLGLFDPGHDDRLETIRLNEHIWERVLELTRFSTYPIWGGFPAGHQRQNHPLPVGMDAVMNSAAGLLVFNSEKCRQCNV